MIPFLKEIKDSEINSVKIIFFDFDGVFTDNHVYTSEDGIEFVKSYRSDGIGLSRLRDLGIKIYIISTETNKVVVSRAKKLNINCFHGIKNKDQEVLRVCNELSIDPAHAVFVGNDINDISAFKVVGLPIGVANCFKEAHPFLSYITSQNGGFGAVREICDEFFKRKSNNLNTTI